MRRVICHYHIYKNAGTSFEAVLDESFGEGHLRFDGPFPFFTIDQEQLDRIILRKTAARAFSSHQIQLPVPVSAAYSVVPVVFLRHPVLRIASVWRFKRAAADGTETSRLARGHDFAGWIEACLADPQEIAQVSNAQTRLLSARFRARAELRRVAGAVEYDLDTALANLATVDCLGRTETFAEDVRAFAARLAPLGLQLTLPADLHRNATWRPNGSFAIGAQADSSADGKTKAGQANAGQANAGHSSAGQADAGHASVGQADVRQAEAGREVEGLVEAVLGGLPRSLRQRLTDANAQDLELYDLACRRGAARQQAGAARAEEREAT
ncbi:MAG: hypothetical protein RLZZ528_792 [Pseudomonadota bacterium]